MVLLKNKDFTPLYTYYIDRESVCKKRRVPQSYTEVPSVYD